MASDAAEITADDGDTPTIWERLQAPFPRSVIQQKPGNRGAKLDFIGARTIAHRMDHVLGPRGWQAEYDFSNGTVIVCRIGIFDPASGQWIWKANGSALPDRTEYSEHTLDGLNQRDRPPTPGQRLNAIAEAYEFAMKSSFTEAFKRCAQNEWGIGRHLYNEPLENFSGRADEPVAASAASAARKREAEPVRQGKAEPRDADESREPTADGATTAVADADAALENMLGMASRSHEKGLNALVTVAGTRWGSDSSEYRRLVDAVEGRRGRLAEAVARATGEEPA
jgi:hypothetical protein